MAWLTISPRGDYEVGVVRDLNGEMIVTLRLPENDGGEGVDLTFNCAGFITFSDWVGMLSEAVLSGKLAPETD